MDVTFTNVLEGARQYFQGLPSASSVDGTFYQHQNAPYQNTEQNGCSAVPSASQPSWSQCEPNRPPTREQTPLQRPSSHSSDGSRPPSQSLQYQDISRQYTNSYPKESLPQTQHQGFTFSRPQSREAPSNQYQSHSVTNSPYIQPATTQLGRTPSKEQVAQPTQNYQHHQSPRYQGHMPHENYQQISYYPSAQSQHRGGNNFKTPPTQSYPVTSQNVYPTQNTYTPQMQNTLSHQRNYATQSSNSVLVSAGANNFVTGQSHQSIGQNDSAQSSFRNTHNLPPIASLSNYHSNRNSKEVSGNIASNASISRSSLQASSHAVSMNQHVIQQSQAKSENYPRTSSMYNVEPRNNNPKSQSQSQSYSYVNTFNNAAGTSSNTTSYYSGTKQSSQMCYQHFNQSNPEAQLNETANRPTQVINNGASHDTRSVGVIKQKRESPLDLSVKTVRTSADSTLEEYDVNNKVVLNRSIPNSHSNTSVSSHSYPTLDISSFQRNLSHSSQISAASAPKVDFHPNFNIPTMGHANRMLGKQPDDSRTPPQETSNSIKLDGSYNSYPGVFQNVSNVPVSSTASYSHNHTAVKNVVRTDYSASEQQKDSQRYAYQSSEITKKRTADITSNIVPNKLAKVDNWRQSIDLQIEQKLSSYKQQQQKQLQMEQQSVNPMNKPPTNSNESFSASSNGNYNRNYSFQKDCKFSTFQTNYNPSHSYHTQSSLRQTYVPSPVAHQYPDYHNSNIRHSQNAYTNPASQTNTSSNASGLNKQNIGGAVDKRVLSLLRTSIEVKEQKKMEQLKSCENLPLHPRPDIQHPNTDVTAPLQPKLGVIGRNNTSPFTPTSFPENNMASTYKFPKATESVSCDSYIKQTETEIIKQAETNSMISTGANSDYDGLAARIRTKGELKQGGPMNTNGITSKTSIIQTFINEQIKSPTLTTQNIGSPPKLLKEKLGQFAPRKRLFSRNEEESGNNLPARDKSGLRSSSETSVFDFPDSDDDNEMPVLERQSLESMRRDRKSSFKSTPAPLFNAEAKDLRSESPRPATPDDIFDSLCNSFVDELKNGTTKKQIKDDNAESIAVLQLCPPENVARSEKNVGEKVELSDNCESSSKIAESKTSTPTLKQDEAETESEIKRDERSAFRNKNRVRRKLVSSSESSDDDDEDIPVVDNGRSNAPIEQEADAIATEASQGKEVIDVDAKMSQKSEQLSVVRPARKPLFGTGSEFGPGWEEEVYRYKKSLRMPASLIQVTRPPASMRLSTSLPDLDPCPQSPTSSVTTDIENKETNKKTMQKVKSEPLDSDSESMSNFNIFSKKTNYDSEGSCSVKSLPNTRKENMSILDKLLEKCGGRKKRKQKSKDDHGLKLIPKAENPIELLPTPGLELPKEKCSENAKNKSPVKTEKSELLPFRKDTVQNFKDAFIKSNNNVIHDKFTTVVLTSRTRKGTRALKQRATIKEVFGEDRPASAPPVTCIDNVKVKEELEDVKMFSVNLEQLVAVKEVTKNLTTKHRKQPASETKIKEEIVDEDLEEEKFGNLIIKNDPDAKYESVSLDGDDSNLTTRRKNKFGKLRRKLSSGFDYIRKKKKTKKENVENEVTERKKKVTAKTPESVDDIQREIKSWVLNKGIGESHLHRAARLGYTDITAYCLEKMDSHPSPKDNAGYTPLHEACARGHLHIAKLLLMYGGNVHESAQGGIRALHEAVENGFVEVVRLLLSYGADPALATYSGITPLSLANDENTRNLLKDHLLDLQGEKGPPWQFHGPASCFDPVEDLGYNVLDDSPKSDSEQEFEDIEFEVSETLLPNLYTLRGEPSSERWILLQDLSNLLKVKSRDALLRQIAPPSSSGSQQSVKSLLRELKMTDFLEQAHCCQFLNQGEKINTRASKIALVKYTDRVKELLGIESTIVSR
ncbi:uncharacterized protein LOC132700381 [Cylas formicarius]|uniref:uncharacterized protein LOC132700381 n=1 Tax=Cylas formicarius TaxID=197179 RepID=UPI0029586959|nr:uncharacterized protein LOC132700381 [Cylas formicarius]